KVGIAISAMLLVAAGCNNQDTGEKANPPAPNSNQVPVQLVAKPTATIMGTVLLSEAGQLGHSGIIIYVGGTSHEARTAENGTYTISGVEPGTYTVMAEKNGFQQQSLGRVVINEQPDPGSTQTVVMLKPVVLEKTGSELTTESLMAAADFGRITG